jgi:hypothetical protein
LIENIALGQIHKAPSTINFLFKADVMRHYFNCPKYPVMGIVIINDCDLF